MKPHPDRLAPTLAARAQLPDAAFEGPFAPPGAGSADARIDVKLLAFAAREALRERGTPQAEERLSALTSPDLWAGTVQDGTARGFKVALEEAISLCRPAPSVPAPEPDDPLRVKVIERKELRRVKDLLVASGEARVRFSRKGGVLYVDRGGARHAPDCIRFEDRRDTGTLDAFAPLEGERPRLFLPGFVKPVWLEQGPRRDLLTLEGRLGRRADGFPCRIALEGRKDEGCVRLTVSILNRQDDHRLRIRFYGIPAEHIRSLGAPPPERILHPGGEFLAVTLVRSCGRLHVGDRVVAVPEAQCQGWIEHRFLLGN